MQPIILFNLQTQILIKFYESGQHLQTTKSTVENWSYLNLRPKEEHSKK